MMALEIYLSVFFSVIISGLSVLLIKIDSKTLKLILSFSGAFLFAISVLHLIPEIYKTETANIGIYILIGFFAQILMEFFSEGIEHGHIHVHKDHHHHNAFPLAIMIALSVHSFIEGMPLANNMFAENSGEHLHTGNSLLTGIILHNIPIAIALMSMLLQSGLTKTRAVLWLLFFAMMTPLGTFTSFLIGSEIPSISIYFNRIMAVVVGIFLHISTTILFESSENHRFNLIKFITILIGASVAFMIS